MIYFTLISRMAANNVQGPVLRKTNQHKSYGNVDPVYVEPPTSPIVLHKTNQDNRYPPVDPIDAEPPTSPKLKHIERDNLYKRRYQPKGKGSYGVAYINTNSDPPSIIKRYYRSEYLLNADKISSRFAEMSGNSKVKGEIELVKSKNLENGSQNNSNISVLRMPYLGENLYNIVHKPNMDYIRQILSQPDYVTNLLNSIHSLLGYTSNIAANGYCHGDMHMSNIVMNLSTCEMHIIDFDFFKPFAGNTQVMMEGKRKYFFHYLVPPEYLFLRIMNSDDVSYDQIKVSDANIKYAKEEIIRYYLHYVMKIPNDYVSYIKYIDENNRKNFEYVMELKDKVENLASLVSSHFMQYFDNYILGIDLQLLLLELFDSQTPLPEQIGKPIPEKIKATQELLKRMSSFTIKERPTPKEAYDIMTEIISQRGGRRKTVRNRHRKTHNKRKQKTRR